MLEPRKARLRAPVLRLQIVAAALLSAIAAISIGSAAHHHTSGSPRPVHATAPAHAEFGEMPSGRQSGPIGQHHL